MDSLSEQIQRLAEETPAAERSDRRTLLKRAGLVTSAAVAGTVGAGAVTAPAGAARNGRVRALDVACNIATLTVATTTSETPVPPGFPPQGSTFYVEGAVFSRGAIPAGPGFDYEANLANAIGEWFCYGWFISRVGRSAPHVVSTQIYTLRPIRDARPFPKVQLMSHGFEGPDDPTDATLRSLIGGTGPHAGASGSVRQSIIGTNTTTHPTGLVGPNMRFNFHYA